MQDLPFKYPTIQFKDFSSNSLICSLKKTKTVCAHYQLKQFLFTFSSSLLIIYYDIMAIVCIL